MDEQILYCGTNTKPDVYAPSCMTEIDSNLCEGVRADGFVSPEQVRVKVAGPEMTLDHAVKAVFGIRSFLE